MKAIFFIIIIPCLFFINVKAQDCEPVSDLPQLNEIMADTPTPEDGDSGNPTTAELIEILGIPGTDLGCYVLTDGDWTVTITPGTIIPADGLLVIGFASINPTLVDFDLGTCDCTTANTVNQPFILTNGGEYVAFFDGNSVFLEGLVMGEPSEGNTPPNGASSENGAIQLASVCDNELVVIPSASDFEVLALEPDETYTYIKDNEGIWTTQGSNEANILGVGSIGDCNEPDPAFNGVSSLEIKIFLEGPYVGNGEMNAVLGSLIPVNQPYNEVPYNYTGNEELEESNIVDWLLLEVRIGTPDLNEKGTTVVHTQAVLLEADGDVVTTDGSPIVLENLEIEEEYYLCIRHRNHLDVLSANPFTPAPTVVYDFTDDSNKAFGPEQLKEIEEGVFGMYAGDFTSDGVIQTTDYDLWFANPAILNTYSKTDANLDGTVQNTDYDQWFFNKAKIGTVEIILE